MAESLEVLELIRLAQSGDNDAKTEITKRNIPLIKSILRRYNEIQHTPRARVTTYRKKDDAVKRRMIKIVMTALLGKRVLIIKSPLNRCLGKK